MKRRALASRSPSTDMRSPARRAGRADPLPSRPDNSVNATRSPGAESPLIFGNYAVGFIDLLGQRAALRGQQLLPHAQTEEQKQELIATLKASVGSVAALQQHALDMVCASEPNADSPLRAQLRPEQQALWDEMHRTKVLT
jgi:hypothetical protein